MSTLNRGNETTRLLRVIEDALWYLRDGCIVDAKAVLLSAIDQEQVSPDSKRPRVTYLR